jgi:hypothetical protein
LASWLELSGVTIGVIAVVLLGALIGVRAYLVHLAERAVGVVMFNPPPPDRVLLIRHTADEATGVLVATRFVGWLVSKAVIPLQFVRKMLLWVVIVGMRPLYELRKRTKWLIAAGLLACLATALWLEAAGHVGLSRLFGLLFLLPFAFVVLFGAFFMAALLISGALSLAPILVAIISLPLSTDLVLLSLFIDVSAEATPAGAWLIHHFDATGEGLHHSLAYNDSRVHELIGEWLTQKIG